MSDLALSGDVVSLHLIQNDRTEEKFILGGADDGSIGIWELGCALVDFSSSCEISITRLRQVFEALCAVDCVYHAFGMACMFWRDACVAPGLRALLLS